MPASNDYYQMLTIRCPRPLKDQIDTLVASANEGRDPYSPPVTVNSFVVGAMTSALNPDGGAPLLKGKSARKGKGKSARKGKRK